jgi:hypothetical protein
VYRRLQDHETRTALEHRAIDERITAVAQQSVPMVAYQADQRARDAETVRLDREHAADVARLDREREQSDRQANDRLAKIEDRPAMTRSDDPRCDTTAAAAAGDAVHRGGVDWAAAGVGVGVLGVADSWGFGASGASVDCGGCDGDHEAFCRAGADPQSAPGAWGDAEGPGAVDDRAERAGRAGDSGAVDRGAGGSGWSGRYVAVAVGGGVCCGGFGASESGAVWSGGCSGSGVDGGRPGWTGGRGR